MAAVEIAFDPAFRVGDFALRWHALGVTAAILVGLAILVARAGYLPPPPPRRHTQPVTRRPLRRRFVGEYPEAPIVVQPAEDIDRQRLRLDDLVYVVVAIVPGAVIGGRLVHGLVFWEFYAVQPERLLDAQVGSLSLAGAVFGGVVTAGYVSRLLGGSMSRWADVAAIPLLLALGLGKLAQLLGGSGQGRFSDAPWAVALVGPGPWVSVDPARPAIPAQIVEGAWLLVGAVVIWLLVARIARGASGGTVTADGWPPPGAALLAAVGWFFAGRLLVGFSWRDEPMLGPLNGEQLVALGVLLGGGAAMAIRRRAARSHGLAWERSAEP